jgi:hypothetical protein
MAIAPHPAIAMSWRWAYSGSASSGHGTQRAEATDAPSSSRSPKPSNGRTDGIAIGIDGSDRATKGVGARSNAPPAGTGDALRMTFARRTDRESRCAGRAEPSRRGRVAPALRVVGLVAGFARVFGGVGGGIAVARGSSAGSTEGWGGGGGAGGGGGGGGGFGGVGLGSGFGAGFGSGSGGGGGAAANVVVGPEGNSSAEAATAGELANASAQRPKRTSTADPTWCGRGGAAPAPRLIGSPCLHPEPSARDRGTVTAHGAAEEC